MKKNSRFTPQNSADFTYSPREKTPATRGGPRGSLYLSVSFPGRRHARFIQMTQSIFAQGLNSGCNSQMLSNSTKTTEVISTYVLFTVVLTELQVLR